jgi:hypothetical protein
MQEMAALQGFPVVPVERIELPTFGLQTVADIPPVISLAATARVAMRTKLAGATRRHRPKIGDCLQTHNNPGAAGRQGTRPYNHYASLVNFNVAGLTI